MYVYGVIQEIEIMEGGLFCKPAGISSFCNIFNITIGVNTVIHEQHNLNNKIRI